MTKKERITFLILNGILLLTILNSSWFFLCVAKVNITQWIVFNACAPSSIIYLFGILIYSKTKNRYWLLIATVAMMFFGTMGLFVFPWENGTDWLVQFSHIIMTLNIGFALWIILKNGDYKALGIGLLISVLISVPFITFTQAYCRNHAEEVAKILGL